MSSISHLNTGMAQFLLHGRIHMQVRYLTPLPPFFYLLYAQPLLSTPFPMSRCLQMMPPLHPPYDMNIDVGCDKGRQILKVTRRQLVSLNHLKVRTKLNHLQLQLSG